MQSTNSVTSVTGEKLGRRDRTRQALLEAGERLIASSSLIAVSIDDIVAAAKVAKGTFYNHFVDKDALFEAIVDWVRAQVREIILKETCDIEDPARKMARGFCVGLRYQLEHPSRAIYLAHSRSAFRSVRDPVNVGVISFVSEGIASGRFLLATTEAGVLLMQGLSSAAYGQTIHEPEPFATISRSQQLASVLLRGLGIPIDEADMIASQESDRALSCYFSVANDLDQKS